MSRVEDKGGKPEIVCCGVQQKGVDVVRIGMKIRFSQPTFTDIGDLD